MRLSLNWLKDYIDPGCSVDDLVHKLTMAGLEIEAVEKVGADTVLDIEITPNRPDCLSLMGLAREVGAVTGKTVKFAPLKPGKPTGKKFPVVVSDTKDCRRYSATLFEGVTVKKSPAFVSERLAAMGIRTISNAVDVTNVVMIETGQPLHVFDYDKLAGGRIIVRRAKEGESIVTLDGVKRVLDPSILVIADSEKPVAIAGIMGGEASQVDVSTRRILLEAAHFDMGLIRRACRKLGLRSDSAYRFERYVDVHATGLAVQRAGALLMERCGGKIVARADINHAKKSLAKPLKLTEDALRKVLGIPVGLKKAKEILTRLGFPLRGQSTFLLVKAPTWRADVTMVEDLIEEVARIIGFDKMPMSMPKIHAVNINVDNALRVIKQQLRHRLTACGLDEAVTYSMTSRKNVQRCGLDEAAAIAVTNPLSQEQEILRPALLPTMLPSLALNLNRGNRDLRLFELGHIFKPSGETLELGILLTGKRHQDWRLSRKDHLDFVDLKGILENAVSSLGLAIAFKKSQPVFLSPAACVEILCQGKVLGQGGLVDRDVLRAWDIKTDQVYFASLNLTALAALKTPVKQFHPVSDFPAIIRDVSIACPEDVGFGDIATLMRQEAGDLLHHIQLIEHYTGDKITAGHKGLVFSCQYQSSQRTLREEEVNPLHEKALGKVLSATQSIRR